MGATTDLSCPNGQRLRATEAQPIVLTYQGTEHGELHYGRPATGGNDGKPPYDVYIRVEKNKTTWRLQERSMSFAPLSIGRFQTIRPNHLLGKIGCEEGDCDYLVMTEEEVALQPFTINPLQPPASVQLLFRKPVCDIKSTPASEP